MNSLLTALAAHLGQRLKVLDDMEPLDELARITKFARTNELEQLMLALGINPRTGEMTEIAEKDRP